MIPRNTRMWTTCERLRVPGGKIWKNSRMARIIRPALNDPSNYRGLEWIFEYTNQDGALTTWNCGHAAAATFLTHHGAMDPVQAALNIAWVRRHHPPHHLARCV